MPPETEISLHPGAFIKGDAAAGVKNAQVGSPGPELGSQEK